MSSLMSQARVRVQRPASRTAVAAVERARLALVPVRVTRAPRMPFAVLVFAVLGAGVVGLLMFNTHMQQGSFYATRLQARADTLTAREQSLQRQLDHLRDPQGLAVAGKRLGMVAPGVPAFVDLGSGKVVGTPTPATTADAVRINARPPALPSPLNPPPLIIKVKAPATKSTTGTTTGTTTGKTGTGTQTRTGTGHVSTKTGAGTGRNDSATPAHGAHR
jgi:hypothetical protein